MKRRELKKLLHVENMNANGDVKIAQNCVESQLNDIHQGARKMKTRGHIRMDEKQRR